MLLDRLERAHGLLPARVLQAVLEELKGIRAGKGDIRTYILEVATSINDFLGGKLDELAAVVRGGIYSAAKEGAKSAAGAAEYLTLPGLVNKLRRNL